MYRIQNYNTDNTYSKTKLEAHTTKIGNRQWHTPPPHTHTQNSMEGGPQNLQNKEKLLWVILDWIPSFRQKAASCHGPFQINSQHRNGTKIWHLIFTSIVKCKKSGFCCEVTENCTLVGHYIASSDNFLPTFQNNLLVPTAGFKNLKENL